MPCNQNCNRGRMCDCTPDVEARADDDFGLFRALLHPLTLVSMLSVIAAVVWVVWGFSHA